MNKLAIDLGSCLFNSAGCGGPNETHVTEVGGQGVGGLGTLLSVFVSNAIIVAGIIFLMMTIYAGYQILSSAGQRSPQNMEAAKKTLTTSLAGFLLVFASFLIISLIEQITALDIL